MHPGTKILRMPFVLPEQVISASDCARALASRRSLGAGRAPIFNIQHTIEPAFGCSHFTAGPVLIGGGMQPDSTTNTPTQAHLTPTVVINYVQIVRLGRPLAPLIVLAHRDSRSHYSNIDNER